MTDDDDRLTKQAETERTMASEWEKKATLALKNGSESLALQALERKIQHEKRALGYETELADKRAQTSLSVELKNRLRALDEVDIASALEDLKKKVGLPLVRDDDTSDRGLFGLLTTSPTKKWLQ